MFGTIMLLSLRWGLIPHTAYRSWWLYSYNAIVALPLALLPPFVQSLLAFLNVLDKYKDALDEYDVWIPGYITFWFWGPRKLAWSK